MIIIDKSKLGITCILATFLTMIVLMPATILGQHSSNWQIANSGGAITSTSKFTIHSSVGEPIIDNKGSGHYTGSGYLSPGSPTPVEDQEPEILPASFELFQNYPNPFNPATIIEYSLPKRSDVNISIYNILGQKTKNLVSGEYGAGIWQVVWDGTDSDGRQVASGIYFYRIKASVFVMSRKMLMLK